MDLDFITNRVDTGATIPDPFGVLTLQKAGITHVINCQEEHCDLPFLKGTPIKYLRCPTHDDGGTKGVEWFGQGVQFALEALATPGNKVYIHCAAGINRGPSMAYAVLRAQGLDGRLVRSLIKEARPEVGLAYRHDADAFIKAAGYE